MPATDGGRVSGVSEIYGGGAMSDYVIHAKLKNGNLLRAILAVAPNVNAFCVEHKLSPTTVGNLINLRDPALLSTGAWREMPLRLSDILGPLPDELFVAEQQTAQLKTNQAYIDVSRDMALTCATGLERIEEKIDAKRVIEKIMTRTTDREREVLDCRYKNDMTLEDTARHMGVSRERVRQIEAKAIRKARAVASKNPALMQESLALVA